MVLKSKTSKDNLTQLKLQLVQTRRFYLRFYKSKIVRQRDEVFEISSTLYSQNPCKEETTLHLCMLGVHGAA